MATESPEPHNTVSKDASTATGEKDLTSPAGGASQLNFLKATAAIKVLTFVTNQLFLRSLSPTLFGISIQLEVYSISVLIFARESLRVAIQRQSDIPDAPQSSSSKADAASPVPADHVDARTAAGRTQTIVNLAWISVYAGPFFALLLGWLYVHGGSLYGLLIGWLYIHVGPALRISANPLGFILEWLHARSLSSGAAEVLVTPYFQNALFIYGLAACWELLSEPAFVVVQQKSRFGIRVEAEGAATMVKCLVTGGNAFWAARVGKHLDVLPFALGQAAYAFTLGIVYTVRLWSMSLEGGFSLFPTKIHSDIPGQYLFAYFSTPLLILGRSLFLQSILKHFLTQGDTLLIAFFASLKDQGIYAIANNYGGMIARIILQPIEESSRNYYGKLLSGTPSKEAFLKARSNLQTLLRSYILLSVCVLAVGPTIAPLLLKIVAGSRYDDAGQVLSTYCYYIPLLAINGLTEAFVSSVATESEVNQQSKWMGRFFIGFGLAAYFFLIVLNLGAEGLVWANVLNMLFRIIWSTNFISAYLKRNGTQLETGTILPKPATIAAAVAALAAMIQVEKTFTANIVTDLVKAGGVAVVFAIALAISERVYLLECIHAIRGK